MAHDAFLMRHHPSLARSVLFVSLLALAGVPLVPLAGAPLQAQERFARLRGKVSDAVTKAPVVGARVVIAATGRFTATDSLGRFEVRDIPTGVIRFIFTAEGYPRSQVVLAFAPGELMLQDFEMDSSRVTDDTVRRRVAQELPTTEITAPVSRGVRYEDFERRMRTGRGHYITREQIEKANYNTLQDAARTLRGVSVDCMGARSCNIRMVRAPQGCFPQYYVDGREDNMFGPFVAIGDIEGMEIYTGASDVPGEFAGADASCGTVVIWTKSGPPRRAPTKRP